MMSSADAMRARPPVVCAPTAARSPGMLQVRHRESRQPRLRLAAAPGRAFVANFAAGARRSARERRDRRRMIVRLDLHQNVDRLVAELVAMRVDVGEPAPAVRRLRSPPRCRDTPRARPAELRACVLLDHREQRLRLALAIDDPIRVEDLVTAMLGVRLREHHQLDIGRIAAEACRSCSRGSRSRPPTAPGPETRWPRPARPRPRARSGIDVQRPRRLVGEQARPRRRSRRRAASVMRSCRARGAIACSVLDARAAIDAHAVCDAAFDALDRHRVRTRVRCRSPCSTTAKSCPDAA